MLSDVLDHTKILNNTKHLDKLSVTLKITQNKGVGLFATNTIYKGDIIAYYKLKVFRECEYISPTRGVYSCYVYNAKKDIIKNLVADIYPGTVSKPLNGIPFWGHFANEPNMHESSNAELYTNHIYNFRDKKKIRVGDVVLYELRATRYIASGEEILWHYGDSYRRDYTVSKL